MAQRNEGRQRCKEMSKSFSNLYYTYQSPSTEQCRRNHKTEYWCQYFHHLLLLPNDRHFIILIIVFGKSCGFDFQGIASDISKRYNFTYISFLRSRAHISCVFMRSNLTSHILNHFLKENSYSNNKRMPKYWGKIPLSFSIICKHKDIKVKVLHCWSNENLYWVSGLKTWYYELQ